MDNVTTVAPGVTRDDYWWGYRLEGRKEALLAASVAKPEWFPDGLRRNKRGQIIRQRKFTHNGERMECQQVSRLRFCVVVRYAEEESERRRALEAQRDEYEKALVDEQKELSGMPNSHQAYRAQYVRYFEAMYEDRFSQFFGKSKYHGYSYAPEVLDAIEQKMQDIRGILATGRTLYSAEVQQTRIKELKAKVAAVNPDVRAFLDRVITQKS
jgi:hypothetical protein